VDKESILDLYGSQEAGKEIIGFSQTLQDTEVYCTINSKGFINMDEEGWRGGDNQH